MHPPADVKANRRAARAEAKMLLVVLAAGAAPFILAPAKAAALGVAGRGSFAFYQAALLATINISVLGSRAAAYRHHFVGERRFSISWPQIVRPSLPVAGLAGAACIGLGAKQPAVIAAGLVVCIVIAPVFTVLQIEVASAQMGGQRGRVAIIGAAPSVADLLSAAALLALGAYTLTAAIAQATAVEGLRAGIALTYRNVDRRRHRADLAEPAQRAAFSGDSVRLAMTSIGPTLTGNIDLLILGQTTGRSTLGIYAVGKIGFSLTQLAGSISEGAIIEALRRRSLRSALGPLTRLFIVALATSAAAAMFVRVAFPGDFGDAAFLVPIFSGAGALYCASRCELMAMGSSSRASANLFAAATVGITSAVVVLSAEVGAGRVEALAAGFGISQLVCAGLGAVWIVRRGEER